MKKLAIMFVMLLGSVATMQAQSNTTFDFSCPVAPTTAVLSLDGWNSDQLAILDGIGFTPGTSRSDQPILEGIILNYSPASSDIIYPTLNIRISYQAIGFNVDPGVVIGVDHATTYYFRASGGNGFGNLYSGTPEAMIVAIQGLMSSPVDNSPQYSVFETQVRQWNFENQGSIQIVEWDDATGIGSFYPANTETDYSISFFNGRWAAEDQSTEYLDAFGDTLAELMVIVLDRH